MKTEMTRAIPGPRAWVLLLALLAGTPA
jgi:hypothetical protein